MRWNPGATGLDRFRVMSTERLVVATGNRGKLDELQRMLGDAFILIPQAELGIESVAETGSSFLENALIKARHAARVSGLRAIADDSGLEVDALNGAPGVHSARYAGEQADDTQNIEKLLAALEDVPDQQRTARFRCVLVLVSGAGTVGTADALIAEGVWEGVIARTLRGSGGFGYDPVFIDPATGLAAAQLSAAEKNRRSHRGQAVRALVSQFEQAGAIASDTGR